MLRTDTCIEVVKSLGWKVEKRAVSFIIFFFTARNLVGIRISLIALQVKFDEVPFLDEVMAVGIATLILPIKSITRRSTGEKILFNEGKPEAGPCCETLRKAIDDILCDRAQGPEGWSVAVKEV